MNTNTQRLILNAGCDHNPDQEGLELLVRLVTEECAKLARDQLLRSSGLDPESYVGSVTIENIILDHFGAEHA